MDRKWRVFVWIYGCPARYDDNHRRETDVSITKPKQVMQPNQTCRKYCVPFPFLRRFNFSVNFSVSLAGRWDRNNSRKMVFGPGHKSHLSRFSRKIGTNDRHWSRFVPFGGRSRFISGNRSRFVAWTGTNASPAWHVALCGALVPVHGMNRDQRPSPGYKLILSPLPFAIKICWIVCEVWVLAFFSFNCTQGVR
jgi:hypothetical protein